MHFENVQLPATVIAELYKQTLVVLEDIQPAHKNATVTNKATITGPPVFPKLKEAVPPVTAVIDTAPAAPIAPVSPLPQAEKKESITVTAPFKFLGGYDKQVAIVVSEHFHPHIADEDLDFLTKLLKACNLSMNDVAIINVVNNPQSSQLWQLMPSKVMLMFDVDPGTLGLPFRRPHFEVQGWSGSTFMTAPELEKFRLGSDQEIKMLKTKLWLCLQKIFFGK
ncbi:MAG: hypothetical protein ABIX01_16075 [Chitinophagaceae bacterium]